MLISLKLNRNLTVVEKEVPKEEPTVRPVEESTEDKRTYEKKKDHGQDISYENERER